MGPHRRAGAARRAPRRVGAQDLRLIDLTAGDGDLDRAARRQEILLDRVAHLAAPVEAYVLGRGWEELTPDGPDRMLRAQLQELGAIEGLREPLRRAVGEVLARFGRGAPRR